MAVQIFGIRHHGPGSARSLEHALARMNPDCVLIEGPPEANPIIHFVGAPTMQPPVALLVHAPDDPQTALFFPFALFSPEWRALRYAQEQAVVARFIDLPGSQKLALSAQPAEPQDATELVPIHRDPLRYLALAAGHEDGERWWEHLIEERSDASVFEAIAEAMMALRQAAQSEVPISPLEAQREAFMRTQIRAAEREGFQRIAVVCGAWHLPALQDRGEAAADRALLKSLRKSKLVATWIPWTHSRLSIASGYGAGVASPGWYHHLFEYRDQVAARWLIRVARLLRGEGLEVSSAQVIDAVRLAETLAALRERPLPGLAELEEATVTSLLLGDATALGLIRNRLVIGETLGAVPDDVPMVPLQRDLELRKKKLRLRDTTSEDLCNLDGIKKRTNRGPGDLDLREPMDLERSRLLWRLRLLEVPYGELKEPRAGKGTYREFWFLTWQPDFVLRLVGLSRYGQTVEACATKYVAEQALVSTDLAHLLTLYEGALFAGIEDVLSAIVARFEVLAAGVVDLAQLMAQVPSMVRLVRYGDALRATDQGAVQRVLRQVVARVAVALPSVCAGLDAEASELLVQQMDRTHEALHLLADDELDLVWRESLQSLLQQLNVFGGLRGRATRLLLDSQALSADAAATYLGVALSQASEPAQAAAWIEGFLRGSGQLLVLDERLFGLVDDWICNLSAENFRAVVPALRRTFGAFSSPERRQMGQRVRHGAAAQQASVGLWDHARGDRVLPVLRILFGRP